VACLGQLEAKTCSILCVS